MVKNTKHIKKPTIEDAEVYHVEVITKARVVPASDSSEGEQGPSTSNNSKKKKKDRRTAIWEYYVKWAGYDSGANSWEPEENVANCQRLLQSFWNHIGLDDKDYQVGYVEKKFFAKEYSAVQEEARRKREQEERYHMKKRVEVLSSSESNDEPLSKSVLSKKKASLILDEDSEDPPPPPAKALKLDSSSKRVTAQVTQEEEADSVLAERAPSPSSLFSPSPTEISETQPLPAQAKPIPLPLPLKKPFSTRLTKRHNNSHANIAAGTVDISASSSGISTKQRLAQIALNPVLPKNSSVSMLSSESERTRATSTASMKSQMLKSLTFKKKASSGQGSANALIQEEVEVITQSPIPDFHQPVITSTRFDEANSVDGIQPASSAIISPTIEEFLSFRSEVRIPSLLLSTIDAPPIIQRLSAPLQDRPEIDLGPIPPKSLISRKPPPMQEQVVSLIDRTWSWAGSLTLIISDGSEECCNVKIQEYTESIAFGQRLSVILYGVDRIVATSLHDQADISTFLRACSSPSQSGRLAPQSDRDASLLMTLQLYMTKRRQVIFLPARLDEDVIGHMLLYSPKDNDLCQEFNIPPYLRQHDSLLITLLPWSLSPKQILIDWRRPISYYLPSNTSIEPVFPDSSRWERSIRCKISYHHALWVLKFPKSLHDFMTQEGGRPYSTWCDGVDITKGHGGIETTYLQVVMDQCRAKHTNPRSKLFVRAIFIHVGALRTIQNFPQFTEKRMKQPIHFYTYGTHESISPDLWGVQEIWPCGGLITFTPNAIQDSFLDLAHRIRQVHSHPLWACVMIPSVLGMIARLACKDENPLAVFDRGNFLYSRILTAVVSGEIAMLTLPFSDQHPELEDFKHQWFFESVLLQPENERGVLEHAISTFDAKYSNLQQSEWASTIVAEISNNLSHIQRHPIFVREYRRKYLFGWCNLRLTVGYCQFEWVSAAEFDFRDEFYPKQD
ncbi:hypothetical protein AMATHDRAFT_44493 [Amanita thiersii Skay4041]|uniref:Chromo domain-containing protein n=1 Tax=Amanita thiersii Skay4041 TaxID=703135 RepID=A0A2A9P0U7_9AGAR|nr:hypothetical protein AMATHDRAFT_44493 [Amanita thiersii Skay4041]